MPQSEFPVLEPDLQIAFFFRLRDARTRLLGAALSATVRTLGIAEIDKQLAEYVDPDALRSLAASGVRGEVVFPVPSTSEFFSLDGLLEAGGSEQERFKRLLLDRMGL